MNVETATHCEFKSRCPMFPLIRSNAALKVYQQVYCEAKFETCERHKSVTSGVIPPASLLPDGGEMPVHWVTDN
jgi:hypothetical protein